MWGREAADLKELSPAPALDVAGTQHLAVHKEQVEHDAQQPTNLARVNRIKIKRSRVLRAKNTWNGSNTLAGTD